MSRSTPSSLPPPLMQGVINGLDNYVSSITAKTVLTIAARRMGVSRASLVGTALPQRMIDEMVRALRMYVKDPDDLQQCRKNLETLGDARKPTEPSSFKVAIEEEQDIVFARGRVRELARVLGFGHTDQIKIATSVSETARNIYNYARRGMVAAGRTSSTRPGLWVRATDEGPGIDNLEEILGGGYRSKTGMGLGLLACRQLMDTFQIVSRPGSGTSVSMEKFL